MVWRKSISPSHKWSRSRLANFPPMDFCCTSRSTVRFSELQGFTESVAFATRVNLERSCFSTFSIFFFEYNTVWTRFQNMSRMKILTLESTISKYVFVFFLFRSDTFYVWRGSIRRVTAFGLKIRENVPLPDLHKTDLAEITTHGERRPLRWFIPARYLTSHSIGRLEKPIFWGCREMTRWTYWQLQWKHVQTSTRRQKGTLEARLLLYLAAARVRLRLCAYKIQCVHNGLRCTENWPSATSVPHYIRSQSSKQ